MFVQLIDINEYKKFQLHNIYQFYDFVIQDAFDTLSGYEQDFIRLSDLKRF
jgi:hypothetical protein